MLLIGFEKSYKSICQIFRCQSVEHMELARHIQIELPEKALSASRKAELLYREAQLEELIGQLEESSK